MRSSATAEDLPEASFAGQQETFLNVVGAEAVLDAARRCWASLWADRAVSYRATHAIAPRAVHLAIVVQRMVDAQVAGVLFTANPLSGKRRQAVVDANPGLGEAVVSGVTTPDHFVVDTLTEVSRGEDVVRAARAARPDVALLDIEMPGGGGIQAAHALHAALPACRVVMLTTFGRSGYLRRAIESGAVGSYSKRRLLPSLPWRSAA